MKKVKAKAAKTLKACAECGSKILKSKGKMSNGKFYCADCK
jgi:formylmethanofuran dehydrogenase subunit E